MDLSTLFFFRKTIDNILCSRYISNKKRGDIIHPFTSRDLGPCLEPSHFRPIDHYIPPIKRQAERHYWSHPYFTKRAYNVVSSYIQAFTNRHDTVCDPFCGSGVTAVEALVLKRRIVALDIVPLACFITKVKCMSPVNLDLFMQGFQSVAKICQREIQEMYQIPEIDAMHLKPRYWYPSDPLPRYVDQHNVQTLDRLFTNRQLAALSELLHAIECGVKDPPSKVLLRFVFSAILARCSKTYNVPKRKYKGETSGNSSIFTHYKYWIPKRTVDLDVWKQFENRFKAVYRAKAETNKLIGPYYHEKETCNIFEQSATSLVEIKGERWADYVFADPPYGSNIAYNDLSTLWHGWLGLDSKFKKDEIIEGGSEGKSREEYTKLMREAIENIYKSLKPERWFSLVYVHKDPSLWNAILEACRDVGFKYRNGVPQPTSLVSYQKVRNRLRTISGEMIINFQRPLKWFLPETVPLPTIDTYILRESKRVIIRLLGADIDTLYFHIVSKLLELNGGILGDQNRTKEVRNHLSSLPDFLTKHFLCHSNLWLLKEECELDSSLTIKENSKYAAFELLFKKQEPQTIENVLYHVLHRLPQDFKNTIKVDDYLLRECLEEIGEGTPDGKWRLKTSIPRQLILPFYETPQKEKPRRPKSKKEVDPILADLDTETIRLWNSLDEDIQICLRELFAQIELPEGSRLEDFLEDND